MGGVNWIIPTKTTTYTVFVCEYLHGVNRSIVSVCHQAEAIVVSLMHGSYIGASDRRITVNRTTSLNYILSASTGAN